MKCFRQLLRQPIKFIAGLILMTMAASIVCICVGQALAAQNTAQQLEQQFTTLALPAGTTGLQKHGWSGFTKPLVKEELLTWLDEVATSNADLVKSISNHGFLSAYIPELTPMNYTQGDYISDSFDGTKRYWYYQPEPAGIPYSCAMLVISLDAVSEPVEELQYATKLRPHPIEEFANPKAYFNWYNHQEKESIPVGYRISLSGTVTEVVSLQEGYRDPTGMTARLTMTIRTLQELEALNLEVGGQYLVYGMDYYDEDWALRGYLADDRRERPHEYDAFDMKKLRWLSEEEQERIQDTLAFRGQPQIVAVYDGVEYLNQEQTDQMNAISMTLSTPAPLLRYDVQREGEYKHFKAFILQQNIVYTDSDGTKVTMTDEEYIERYTIPTITRLDGSAEDFLASEEGAIWLMALERDTINNHAFAVMGVDKTMYLADFALEESRITQGRDFTEEESESGARVCILHEAVAVASGLDVGDTITLNLYQGDPGLPYQQSRDDSTGLLTPSADFYFDTTPIVETAEYTIIGLWRNPDTWVDVSLNEYGFSPNTVFVPKSSVQTPMEYPESILFSSVILHNGKGEDFVHLATEAGFNDAFMICDQGYTKLISNFHNYKDLAKQVLTVGASVYAVILILFLLLFPGTQGKTVSIMQSLGVNRGKRFFYVMLSTIGVVAPATVMGGFVGLILWHRVLDALQSSAESSVALQLDYNILILLAVVQFFFTMVLTAIISFWVSAPSGMSKRRKI